MRLIAFLDMRRCKDWDQFLKISNYLKTCSTSFLEHKVSHSPPWTPSGCIAGQQLQQHRIQLLQSQMANELVVDNSLIKQLKLSFVSEPNWACFCWLEQYRAINTWLEKDRTSHLLAFILPFPCPQPGFLPWLQLALLYNNDLHCPQDWGQRRWGNEDRTDTGTVWWLPLPGNILSACLSDGRLFWAPESMGGVMMLLISSVLSGHRWTKQVPRKLEEGKGGTGGFTGWAKHSDVVLLVSGVSLWLWDPSGDHGHDQRTSGVGSGWWWWVLLVARMVPFNVSLCHFSYGESHKTTAYF